MSKKVLKQLFLMSDESSYGYNDIDDGFKEISNNDFVIDRNFPFFLLLYTKKGEHFISIMAPKFWIYFGLGMVFSIIGMVDMFFIPGTILFLKIAIIFDSFYVLLYSIFYIKNFKIIRKFRKIKKTINYNKENEEEKELKNIADDIINNNIKVLRKLKLENLKK